ncbi:MAG: serine hydrolase domain-containing protein [Phycisphaerales bacterium]
MQCIPSVTRVWWAAAVAACALVSAQAAASSAAAAPTDQAASRAANTPATPALTAAAQSIQKQYGLPALLMGSVDRNGLQAAAVAGTHGTGTEAATLDDRIHLGSCTKAFTATLAAALVADGALTWDSTVGQVLGASVPDMNEAWKGVTLEQLLRHRAGAPASPPSDAWVAAAACQDNVAACRAAFVDALLAKAPAQAPGTFTYSNQGYAIAGRMLEVAGKDTYEALLERRVLKPLGITHAGFGPPSKVDANALRGHQQDGALNDTDNPSAIAPAGTLHMTLGDWARFIAFHMGATPPKELEGAAAQLAKLHAPSPTAPNEGMGWLVTTRPWGGTVLTHAGSNTLWYCVAWVSPEKGFAMLAATNIGGDKAQAACDAACVALMKQRAEAGAAGAAKPSGSNGAPPPAPPGR